tara:strand:+ start:1169 stop:2158 length:990 start_codon:yes stop_codon:yes gene_type:complete
MDAESKNILTIGNSIVDLIFKVDESFLQENGLVKGAMTLVNVNESTLLREKVDCGVEISGGSAANTAVGISSLGGRVKFIGKVSQDNLGNVFKKSIIETGVRYTTEPSVSDASTANCLVFVTPDGERTMCTYLGSCVELNEQDIDKNSVISSKITYIEGYLWDPNGGKAALKKVCALNEDSNRLTSFSLSDSLCVERYREDFHELTKSHIDILFSNEQEIKALYKTNNFDEALSSSRGDCDIVIVTRGANGSLILTSEEVHQINPPKISQIIDTTGAGDMYAAGFLYGYSKGFSVARSGRLGSLMSGEIISHIGARPEKNIKEFIEESA